MFDSPVLNVVIGLIFVYLLYSLFATIVQEMIASFFSLRAKTLSNAIERMLEDGGSNTTIWTDIGNWAKSVWQSFWHRIAPVKESDPETLAQLFFNNPGIKYLADGKKNSKPSYLEPTVFSKALIDVLKGTGSPIGNTVAQIKNVVDHGTIKVTINNKEKNITLKPDTQAYLQSLINDSNNDIDKFKASLEQWFNNMMDRASGWYKRQGQRILLVIGLCIAVSFNVDTIGIAGSLSDDPKAADRMATMAAAYVKDPKSAAFIESVNKNKDTGSIAYKELQEFYKTNQADIAKANQVLGLGWNLVKQHKYVDITITKCCRKKYDKIGGVYDSYTKGLKALTYSHDSLNDIAKSIAKKINTILITTSLVQVQPKNAGLNSHNNKKKDSVNATNPLVLSLRADSIDIDTKLSILNAKIAARKKDQTALVSAITGKSFITSDITENRHDSCFIISGERHYNTCEKICFISGNIWNNPKSILGFLITAIAISLGAPFWFDLLSKVVNLRNAGAKPDDSPTPTSGAGSNNTPAVVPPKTVG